MSSNVGKSMIRKLSLCLLICIPFIVQAQDDPSITIRNDKLLEILKQEWTYPETGFAARGRTGSILTMVQQSEDSYAKVWNHYVKLCGFKIKYKDGMYVQGREHDDVVYFINDRTFKPENKRRTFFVANGPGYSVNVILEPIPGDEPTRISLTLNAR
ncbi:MAG: hypothetical protein HUJ26_07975 [Planctomycetaceae bacterium]|nr:hypothetical protein [Planctomycetaceae bacterium]